MPSIHSGMSDLAEHVRATEGIGTVRTVQYAAAICPVQAMDANEFFSQDSGPTVATTTTARTQLQQHRCTGHEGTWEW